ncbi:hypothetical protein ACGFZS_35910 [Streptomyces sp. NPDC048288]|uniref:hypothetical protein n=1 Tax=Streptomyces sp. NPDC048288 TaxID=3365529 RepID=UPI0037131AA6
MQSPLPRRPKGPSAIAAASASHTAAGSGPEDASAPEARPDATRVPMSAAAAAFATESAPSREATGTRPDRTDTGTADPSTTGTRTTGARLPRSALLAGAAVVVAALVAGAFLVGRAGGDDTRRSSAQPDAVSGTAGTAGPYDSTPSLLGPPPPSMSPSASRSASPSTDATGGSSRSTATGSAKDGQATTRATPSTASAKDTGTARTGSGGDSGDGGDGSSCVSAKGSGALTDYSVCVSSGTLTLRVTFHRSQPFYHAFFNTDGDTTTGYRLPYPSPSALGADYMIENGSLYRSRATDWSWTETAPRPKYTVSGSTQTWTLPLGGIGAPTGTQQLEFNAGSDYTPVLTFSPK